MSIPIKPARLAALAVLLCGVSATTFAQSDEQGDSPGAEARLLTNIRQLTFEGRRAGEGYFSADGTQMVFQSEREPGNPFYQIYLMDLETGDVERVSPGTGRTTCSWIHPKGGKVLFASTHLDPQAETKQAEELALRASGKQRRYSWSYDEHYDIFECDLKTKQYKNLTNLRGYDAEGSWSPDGTLIAFASNRHAYTGQLSEQDAEHFKMDQSFMMEIYIMDADGSNVRRLTNVPGYDGGPFFSPDGKRLCWRRFSEDGATAEIWTMNIDGSDQRQLTELGAMSWAPYYHPSSQYLIFTTNKHGFANFELYLVDVAGRRKPVRVSYTDGWDGLPVFSPDGKQLAWSTKRATDGTVQIYWADWNHQAALKMLGESGPRSTAAPIAATADTRSAPPPVDTEAAISVADLRKHIEYLASDELEGRMTGSRGEQLATAYVGTLFEKFGLTPAGDDGTFFQPFEFTLGVALGEGNALSVYNRVDHTKTDLKLDQDWRPLAFARSGEIDYASVMFGGYGILAPQSDTQPVYDSFDGADVAGKWVMVLKDLPEAVSPERRQHLARYASLRCKAMLLRDRKAAGMIVVTHPNAAAERELIPLNANVNLATTNLPVVSISNATAEELVAPTGRQLDDLQTELDTGVVVPVFDLAEVMVGGRIELKRESHTGRNVLGRLAADAQHRDVPALVMGAHVDHHGHTGENARASSDARDQIHYGADDYASGVAALLEIAESLADARARGKLSLERDIVFAAWSGAEVGLLGSAHFVAGLDAQTPTAGDISPKIAAYLNLDRVDRLGGKLILNGVGSSSIWPREIERRNIPVGLDLAIVEDSYLPSDSTSFYLAHVPILSAFTDAHADARTPVDTAERINYEGMQRIARLMSLIARSIARSDTTPGFVRHEISRPRGARAGLRAYLGTVPDYAKSDVPGVKLSGVSKGGPAAEAGLQGGDIIIKLAGAKVADIHQYTAALDGLAIGEPVEIVVLRDGRRVTLEVTPGSRE